jgi:Domain of unknown function (DUF4114)
MADITLGTPIAGSIAGTETAIANTSNPFVGLPFDEYNITGLPSFNQVEITVTPDAALGAGGGAVQVVNAATGAVLTQNSFFGVTPRVVTGTSFPGINYKVQVVGTVAAPGNYTLTMTDAGKANSIVTPLTARDNGDGISQTDVGTIGPNSELFPLASSAKGSTRLFDIALAPDNKLYGIGPNSSGQDTLYAIDPGRATTDQVTQIGLVKDFAGASLSNTFNALEFRAAGDLYAIGNKSNKLYTINPTTAIATPVIGDLPAGFVSSGDLVADATGSRFLATSTDTATGDALWSIPFAAPASATKIGNIGFTGVTGLSFEGNRLTGFTSGNAAATGDLIVIDLATGNGTAQDKIGDSAIPPLTNGIGGASTIAGGTPVATNLAPTGITFSNSLASIAKTTSTTAAVKVADLTATDDGLGTNVFSLTGADAASFEITGTSLFLKAGTVLNPATKASLGVTVNVDDAAVGATPDATKIFTLAVTDTTVVTPTPTKIGTKGQSATQRTIDLTDYVGTLKADVKTNGDAAYTNNIGFYVVQDAIGTIKLANGNTLKPGDTNYAAEAVKSALLQTGKNDSKLDQNITGGSIYAPVVVAQGSLADFVSKNPSNSGGSNQIHAYFNYLGANTDNFDHFRRTGDNTFAVEDMYGGGDRDFNDLVVNMNVKQVAQA